MVLEPSDADVRNLDPFCLATWGMTFVLPSGFIPNEDQGMIYVNVDAPPGATLERSEAALNKVQAALLPLEEVETISTLAGYSLMTETEGASFGMGMINLTPWDQREQTAAELMSVYADRVAHIKDADIQFFLPPTVPGFGNASGFELRLQDKTAGTFAELDEVAKNFVAKLNADPRLTGVTSGFNPNFPQYLLRVDLAKAAKLGINVNESMETLQSYVGSFYSSNFVRFGQMYKVMLQAAPEYRMNPEDLFSLYAKNKEGNMVPYSNFMTMERVWPEPDYPLQPVYLGHDYRRGRPVSARVRLWLLSRRSLPRYCPVVTIPNGPVWRRRRMSPVGKHW